MTNSVLSGLCRGLREVQKPLTDAAASLVKDVACLGTVLRLNKDEIAKNLPYLVGALHPITRPNFSGRDVFRESVVAVASYNQDWLDMSQWVSEDDALESLKSRKFSHGLSEVYDYEDTSDRYELVPELEKFLDVSFSGESLAYVIETTQKFKAPISSKDLYDLIKSDAPILAFKDSEFATMSNEDLAKFLFKCLRKYLGQFYCWLERHCTCERARVISSFFSQVCNRHPKSALVWLVLVSHHTVYFEEVNFGFVDDLPCEWGDILDTCEGYGLVNPSVLEHQAACYDIVNFFVASLDDLRYQYEDIEQIFTYNV